MSYVKLCLAGLSCAKLCYVMLSCAMLCYVMFIFKINFHNKLFKIECSKSTFQNRSFRTVIFRILRFPKLCIFKLVYDFSPCLCFFSMRMSCVSVFFQSFSVLTSSYQFLPVLTSSYQFLPLLTIFLPCPVPKKN